MGRIYISIGDFLKNAGIVGLKYLLEESDADEDIDYGITGDGQELWIDQDYAVKADWTDMYFNAFVKWYGPYTVYQAILDKIDSILETAENDNWKPEDCKDDIKFINDKLLSNSYKSGFENIKDKIDNPEIYRLLITNKLKVNMESQEILNRLQELKQFLVQPLCKKTFSMKSIIYNYINRFWDGKSFLLRSNAAKDIRDVFDADFSEPLRKYIFADHEKSKDMCIDCNKLLDSKEKVSIAFMKDQADDLSRKKSAFWNCKVDAYLCPICAFVYSLAPLGFLFIGNKFLFINVNQNIHELVDANCKESKTANETEKQENEKYSTWIARTIDILLDEKVSELGNIQVISRGRDENDRYTFDVISKDVLSILKEEGIQKDIKRLSEHPYIKNGKEFLNIHENVVMNILEYQNQYKLLNRLLKLTFDTGTAVFSAGLVYDIQLRTNLKQRKDDKRKIGGALMNRYKVRDSGYELRNTLLASKGTNDDSCIRGTIYQLLNALSVGNVEHFMDIIMRVYCSTKLQIPNAFIELLKDRETFLEYGYAFVLGLQGSHYEKKGER